MTHRHTQHARQVVNHFRETLPAGIARDLGAKHYDELTLMIESAISAAVLEELERAADRLDALSRALRSNAEHFED